MTSESNFKKYISEKEVDTIKMKKKYKKQGLKFTLTMNSLNVNNDLYKVILI